MTSKQRAVLLGLAALTVVVAVILASNSGGSDDEGIIDTRTQSTQVDDPSTPATATTTSTPTPPKPKAPDTTVVIEGGEPSGGVEKFRFRKGSVIKFTVRSDASGEIHLHGYDVTRDVEAGQAVRFSVPATIDGRFEVEFEETETQIASVEVVP